MVERQQGNLPLPAQALFLLMAEDGTGRLRLSPQLAGIALAVARVGELMLDTTVLSRRTAEQTVLTTSTRPDGDLLRERTRRALSAVRPHPTPRQALEVLAADAYTLVGDYLVAAGHVQPKRTLFGLGATVYRPVDANADGVAMAALRRALAAPEVSGQTLVLVAALDATGRPPDGPLEPVARQFRLQAQRLGSVPGLPDLHQAGRDLVARLATAPPL
ncbi:MULTISPECIES: GPP34 family phosphoprotein [Actinosynnema]|uniref:GPP34 family phosphoprotein n=1 Tax=Actinosynnema TaxID=40566 RepID=UPI0020A2AF9C|nr:GPP34 family phosphoprotein [Actinosynnema pretiosum]MCP2097411.1 Golgi phosphoprotein 3 (GPP34) [Actinosynnema pretiosum]